MTPEALSHGTIPNDVAEHLVGAPASVETLKFKPGRRVTARAQGARGSAIIKVYASDRAATVAGRVSALEAGPEEPLTPQVLMCDPDRHVVALSEVPGEPLRGAFLTADMTTIRRAGRALGRWHSHWRGRSPAPLRLHAPQREIETLLRQAERAPAAIAEAVGQAVPGVLPSLEGWDAATVVHRDLYEDQIIVGDSIGLIDLDDAAIGPPELDIGNLAAHVDLMASTQRKDLGAETQSFLDGYLEGGGVLRRDLLAACTRVSRLRLACIHAREDLLLAAVSVS